MKTLKRKKFSEGEYPKGFLLNHKIWINIELLWNEAFELFVERFTDVYTHEMLHVLIQQELGTSFRKRSSAKVGKQMINTFRRKCLIDEERIIYKMLEYDWTQEIEDYYYKLYM